MHAALQYLQKALKIESRLPDVENPADTHLNTCAVLSQLGRHQSALEHAQSALILLQEELFSQDKEPQADRVAVLGIAYHNIGVEQEFLKKYEQSITSYRKGVEVAEQYLGPKHAITETLRNSLIAAKRAVGAKNPEAARNAMHKSINKGKIRGRNMSAAAQSKSGNKKNSATNNLSLYSGKAVPTQETPQKTHYDKIPEENEQKEEEEEEEELNESYQEKYFDDEERDDTLGSASQDIDPTETIDQSARNMISPRPLSTGEDQYGDDDDFAESSGIAPEDDKDDVDENEEIEL